MTALFIDIHTHQTATTCSVPLFSYGIHPWWLRHDHDPAKYLEFLETLLQEHRIAAIGETGIDHLDKDTIPLQLKVFEKHILLSEQYQKPLIIHNVKATADLLLLHKKHRPRQTWILHGFNGSEEEARQLTQREICLSVGESLYYQNRKINKTIKSIPLDYLFLETDMSEHSIQDIYAKASERLNLPKEVLKTRLFANFARLNITRWKTGETEHDCSSETMALINLERAMS